MPVREACEDEIHAMEPLQFEAGKFAKFHGLLTESERVLEQSEVPEELQNFREFEGNSRVFGDSAPESTTSVMVKTTGWLVGRASQAHEALHRRYESPSIIVDAMY